MPRRGRESFLPLWGRCPKGREGSPPLGEMPRRGREGRRWRAQQRPPAPRPARRKRRRTPAPREPRPPLHALGHAAYQPAQRPEPVRRNAPGGHEQPERVVDLRRQPSRASHDVRRERRPLLLEAAQHVGGCASERRFRVGGVEQPRRVLPYDHGDRAVARERRCGGRAVPPREPPPCEFAAKRQGVERRWVEVGEPVGKQRALPGRRCGLEPLELLDDLDEPGVAREARAGRDVLPFEQEADEARYGRRLDLAAQASNGAPVDAGEDATVAELLALCARTKAPPQHDALGFQPHERLGQQPWVEREQVGEVVDGKRPRRFGASAHDIRDGIALGALSPALPLGGRGHVLPL